MCEIMNKISQADYLDVFYAKHSRMYDLIVFDAPLAFIFSWRDFVYFMKYMIYKKRKKYNYVMSMFSLNTN